MNKFKMGDLVSSISKPDIYGMTRDVYEDRVSIETYYDYGIDVDVDCDIDIKIEDAQMATKEQVSKFRNAIGKYYESIKTAQNRAENSKRMKIVTSFFNSKLLRKTGFKSEYHFVWDQSGLKSSGEGHDCSYYDNYAKDGIIDNKDFFYPAYTVEELLPFIVDRSLFVEIINHEGNRADFAAQIILKQGA